MTYAGLKSMIYAGLGPNDERVKAAIGWLKKNYDLNSNPGLGNQGLYYYYQTFGKAMAALGQDTFVDAAGVNHDWRKDLIEALAARQRPDGSWANDNQRWMEGDANLSTGYALLALSYCKK
jgi:squalene-hopene/tetraprenyl-beta-curcumene cyclase